MKRLGEVLHYGAGQWATLAARCRSSGNYCAAAGVETMMGERRAWDEQGTTMFATFEPIWTAEHDRRCTDYRLSCDYAAPMPWFVYGRTPSTTGGA